MPVCVVILFYLWQLLACKSDALVYFGCYFYNDFSLFLVINLPQNWTLSRKKRSNNLASSFEVLKFSLLITIFSFVVCLLIVFTGKSYSVPRKSKILPPSSTSVAIQPVQPLLRMEGWQTINEIYLARKNVYIFQDCRSCKSFMFFF